MLSVVVAVVAVAASVEVVAAAAVVSAEAVKTDKFNCHRHRHKLASTPRFRNSGSNLPTLKLRN
jgi:hypothetical protein